MIIIRNSNQNYLNILGKNLRNNTSIRFIKYLVIDEIDDGKIIHNELTRALVWIPNSEWNNILNGQGGNSFNWLYDNYFLVNENYDEETIQEYVKKTQRMDCHDPNYLKQGHIETFTIFTTMTCNARCFYCYEKGRPQVPMKSETAYKVGDWIVKYAVKNGNTVWLRWFGGEPLVNENAIDIICKIVQDAGFNYKSFITTNGFLFKKEKLDKYKDLWHLDGAQITIDGTEEVYNKAKNYKNITKGISPYQVVCNNIKMLADNDIHVSIRMNLDTYNADNIKQLIPELFTKFGHHPNIWLYNWPIFEEPEKPRTDEENKVLYQLLTEADEVLDKYGYYHPSPRCPNVMSVHCMVDDGKSVIIGTQGDIGVCEHYSEDHFWGNINDTSMRNQEMIDAFQEYEDHGDLCKNCPIKPGCIKIKLCRDLRGCNEWHKQWQIRRAKDSIKTMYKDFIKNAQNMQSVQQNKQNKSKNKEVKKNKVKFFDSLFK